MLIYIFIFFFHNKTYNEQHINFPKGERPLGKLFSYWLLKMQNICPGREKNICKFIFIIFWGSLFYIVSFFQLILLISSIVFFSFVFYVNGEKKITDVSATDGKWHMICVIWKSKGGKWAIFKDGIQFDSGEGLSKDKLIEGKNSQLLKLKK